MPLIARVKIIASMAFDYTSDEKATMHNCGKLDDGPPFGDTYISDYCLMANAR